MTSFGYLSTYVQTAYYHTITKKYENALMTTISGRQFISTTSKGRVALHRKVKWMMAKKERIYRNDGMLRTAVNGKLEGKRATGRHQISYVDALRK